jgi:hypothetical protein
MYRFHMILRINSNYFPKQHNTMVFLMALHYVFCEVDTSFFRQISYFIELNCNSGT